MKQSSAKRDCRLHRQKIKECGAAAVTMKRLWTPKKSKHIQLTPESHLCVCWMDRCDFRVGHLCQLGEELREVAAHVGVWAVPHPQLRHLGKRLQQSSSPFNVSQLRVLTPNPSRCPLPQYTWEVDSL